MSKQNTYCGFIEIVGRPNVGKSTLMNQLLGHKVSITSCKPQTTRYPIIGIHTDGPYQAIYIDTPGMQIKEKHIINCLINSTANSYISNIELVIFVVEGTNWTTKDKIIINKLCDVSYPVILAINKVDNIADKEKLLPHMQFLSQQMSFHAIVPICAKRGMNISILSGLVRKTLTEKKHHFPKGYITDHSQNFMASEIIREKLMRFLDDELPYYIEVFIERFMTDNHGCYDINGLIIVKRDSHKKIVIGNKGIKIKIISIEARKDMENIFKKRVRLNLWVKVKSV